MEAHQFLMIICYVDGQIYYQQALCPCLYYCESKCDIEAHHMPKYQQASHTAPFSAPPGRGNQGCQQNLRRKWKWFQFIFIIDIDFTHQTKLVGRLGLQWQDQSLRASPRRLCSCSPTKGFPAGKKKPLVSRQRTDGQDLAKKASKNNTNRKSWVSM